MKYPKPTDRYNCSVLCDNFEEIENRLIELEENSSRAEEVFETLAPTQNLNGCIVCNGEEITLTVGTDIKVGQVLSFRYKKAEGYTISTFGTRMDSVNEPRVMEEGYSEATFTIVEGHDACIIKGAYFVLIPPSASGSGLPKVTETDEGKILRVVNGEWQLVEVLDGNEAYFYADGNEVAY